MRASHSSERYSPKRALVSVEWFYWSTLLRWRALFFLGDGASRSGEGFSLKREVGQGLMVLLNSPPRREFWC